MFWRRILLLAATSVALILSVHLCLETKRHAYWGYHADDINAVRWLKSFAYAKYVLPIHPDSHTCETPADWITSNLSSGSFLMQDDDLANSCYPFFWQQAQRERLHAQLEDTAYRPIEGDGDEDTIREGLRREPKNALYHYRLADLYLAQSLKRIGSQPDIMTGAAQYAYTITDRRKLDLAMKELAIGSRLPFHTHRTALLRAQLAALPPMRDHLDRLKITAVLSSMRYPEYVMFRNFARENGFYLSVLLSEGKRAEAEPFLHLGERLVVQISNDESSLLLGQLTALKVGTICQHNDARVCRAFGLTREADEINARQEVLIAKLRAWHDHARTVDTQQLATRIHEHAGLLPSSFLMTYEPLPEGMITEETLRPSRLAEYVTIERSLATRMSLIAFLLLAYAGLHIWRWTLATRGQGVPVPTIGFTPAEWTRIIGYGLLAPLVLYLLYIAIPEISGRDHGIQLAWQPFANGLVIFTLWTFIVPTTMAAGIHRRRSIAEGLLPAEQSRHARISRLLAAFLAAVWSVLALILLLLPIMWVLTALLFAESPFSEEAHIVMTCLCGMLLLGLPLLPAKWARADTTSAPFHLSMTRSMITVYAVMTLFFASLIPVCSAFERHYVRIDRLMAPMNQGDDIGPFMAEGQLSLMLRREVRNGARTLGMTWK